jgi:hypothetical protein
MLYRRPSEPQAIEVIFDEEIYPYFSPASPGAVIRQLQAATRVVLTMPPRGTLREACDFARKRSRLPVPAACRRAVASAPFCRCAEFPIAWCIGAWRAGRSGRR